MVPGPIVPGGHLLSDKTAKATTLRAIDCTAASAKHGAIALTAQGTITSGTQDAIRHGSADRRRLKA
jgi:hypothetical protein